jgi:arylsulfatase A-like enzyme
VVDAFRYDHLSCYGQNRISTPAIDSLAEKRVLFARAYCSYPATFPSMASMFKSTYVIYNGIKTNGQVLPDSLLTTADILRGRGNQTVAMVSNSVLKKKINIGKRRISIGKGRGRPRDA